MKFDIILFYFLGALITSSVIVTWFGTTLAVHISKKLRLLNSDLDIYTWEEWSDYMLIRYPFFGELLSCPLCLGFWVSLVVATILSAINPVVGYWFIAASGFSWPLISYLAFRISLKSD